MINNVDILDILADDGTLRYYRAALTRTIGGVLATVLLERILFWWKTMGRVAFYKFRTVCPDNNPHYRPGDSWCEELAFSEYEFDGALKKIARKVTQGADLSQIQDADGVFVLYWTGVDRRTWYTINEGPLRKALNACYASKREGENQLGNAQLRNWENRDYVIGKTAIRKSGKPRLDNTLSTALSTTLSTNRDHSSSSLVGQRSQSQEDLTHTEQAAILLPEKTKQAISQAKKKKSSGEEETERDPRIRLVIDGCQAIYGLENKYKFWGRHIPGIKKLLEHGYSVDDIVGCWAVCFNKKDEFVGFSYVQMAIADYCRKKGRGGNGRVATTGQNTSVAPERQGELFSTNTENHGYTGHEDFDPSKLPY